MGYEQIARYSGKFANGLSSPFVFAGVPTSGANGTFVKQASKGSLLIDTVNGKLYQATSTTVQGSTVTWALVGSQV